LTKSAILFTHPIKSKNISQITDTVNSTSKLLNEASDFIQPFNNCTELPNNLSKSVESIECCFDIEKILHIEKIHLVKPVDDLPIIRRTESLSSFTSCGSDIIIPLEEDIGFDEQIEDESIEL